ncbi:MAG: carboxypeptidase regulatory-like domain-containing protein [Acidobacteria bacterium]|nr:carboxypeptidase regulatory-like domain-containing protein [Acidobacteriota bacterium]
MKAFRLGVTGSRPVTLRAGATPAAALLPGACASPGAYLLRSRSLVSLPFGVDRDVCRRGTVTVRLFPRATLRVHLTAPGSAKLPHAAILELSHCPKGLTVQPVAHTAGRPLPIPASGTIEATVPSGCLDITLVTKRFAPISWWGLKLSPGKVADLGVARLKTGASLLVRTIDADDGWALPGARVELVDAGHVRAAIRAALRGALPHGLASGVSGARGWLRLSGLPDGRYTLIATAKAHAVACRNVVLASGKETVADDVEIGRPGSLDISVGIDPSSIPTGYALKLSFRPTVCCHQFPGGVRTLPVPDSGYLHVTGLNPGLWQIVATLVTPAGLAYDIGSARTRVASGSSGALELDLTGALYHGAVTRRDEPVAADLRFEREHSESVEDLETTSSGADGSFAVFLRHPGTYDVQVSLPKTHTRIPVTGVVVTKPDTPVRVVIPSGSVNGVVVDSHGAPVAGADVLASGRRRGAEGGPLFAEAESGTDGTFTIDGVTNGSWSVSAERGDLASAPARFRVSKEQQAPWVKLVVRKTFTQRGRVVFTDHSPAAGVLIGAWDASAASRGAAPQFADASSRADGSFELRVNGRAGDIANVFVSTVGVAADAFRLPLSRTPWTLRVSRAGGRLQILFPGKTGLAAMGSVILVRPDGAALTLAAFGHGGLSVQPGAKGAVVSIANLATGPWRVVWGGSPGAERAVMSGAGMGLRARAQITMTAGGTAHVTFAPDR